MKDSNKNYLKWGSFKSQDSEKPDVLEFKVLDTETFDTEYSTNIKALHKTNNGWNEVILPLKSHSSYNKSLLTLWEKAVKKREAKSGKKFSIRTWLGVSKNDRPIRRFELIF